MKNIISVIIVVWSFNLSAQHTISGSFSPAKDYTWLIAYRLEAGTQVYAADTAIKNGKFILTLPIDAVSGTYRFVYAVPQEKFNFDVIYNGQEDIELNFNREKGVAFTTSKENILLHTYLNERSALEHEIINFYKSQDSNTTHFSKITLKLATFQNEYETKSQDLIACEFIAANTPYIPQKSETFKEYLLHKKENYFSAIDFKNPVLQNSSFLTNKVASYVFTALPLALISKEQTEKDVINNTITIGNYLKDLNPNLKFHIYNRLWNYAVAYSFNNVSDFIYNSSLRKLAIETNNVEIKKTIEAHNRLRLGAIAPEITWKNGQKLKKLSELQGAENYLLVFWSSTCGHCLKELPALHKELKGKTSIKVIAVGLEDGSENWAIESAKLDGFEHVISLGKWESEYVALYDIHATPTYYVLDKDKRIIANPEDDKAVIEFLEKNH